MDKTLFFPIKSRNFEAHWKFDGVNVAKLLSKGECSHISTLILEIIPGAQAPIHTHEKELDAIYIISGEGSAYINGSWQEIQAGDYLYVPQGVEHGVKNTGESNLLLLAIHNPPFF